MLAVQQQQQQPPLPTHPPPPDVYTRTMSLAVLPSSPVTTFNSQPDLPTTSPSPAKRPKLSLDTLNVAPIAFGKKATSLRLETLSATSPTIRNTFSNAHEQKKTRPSKLQLTPIATSFSDSPEEATPSRLESPTPDHDDDSARSISSSGSSSSVSTTDSALPEVPYKLPFNHNSILKNGPIDRRSIQMTSFATSKPMFPAAKKVGFKAPLEEEIRTTKFTLRHSDIESSSSTISTLDLNEGKQDVEEREEEDTEVVKETGGASPQTGDKRESSDEEEDEEDNESREMYPTTPVAGRRKRHRQWVWTLGPVYPAKEPSDATERSEEVTEGS